MAYEHARGRRPPQFEVQVRQDHQLPYRPAGCRGVEGFFTESGTGCLRVVFGEHPGLSAGELVMAYDAGIKAGSSWRMAKQGGAEGDPKEEKGPGFRTSAPHEVAPAIWRRGAGRWDDRRTSHGWGESASEPVHGYNYGETANINRGSYVQFPPPPFPIWQETSIANKWLIGFGVRFRPLFGLPNRTKFYHFLPKTCSERARRGR